MDTIISEQQKYRAEVEHWCDWHEMALVVNYTLPVTYMLFDEEYMAESARGYEGSANRGRIIQIYDQNHNGNPMPDGKDVDWRLIWKHLDHNTEQRLLVSPFEIHKLPEPLEIKLS